MEHIIISLLVMYFSLLYKSQAKTNPYKNASIKGALFFGPIKIINDSMHSFLKYSLTSYLAAWTQARIPSTTGGALGVPLKWTVHPPSMLVEVI